MTTRIFYYNLKFKTFLIFLLIQSIASLEIRPSSPVPLTADVSDTEWSPLKTTMHPNARHGVELSEQDFDTLVGRKKKRTKKLDPVFDSLLKKKKKVLQHYYHFPI